MNNVLSITTDKHPISIIGMLIQRFGKELTLEFSKYFYRPQSVTDQRYIFSVPIAHVSEAWLQAQLQSLEEGWEFALHSIVRDHRGRTKHIGMIDFSEHGDPYESADLLANILGRNFVNNMVIFNSGRSFHGYSLVLLDPKEWLQLMGKLLLLNIPNKESLVDSRWIGHRVIAGYSSLRWSMNTNWYRAMPTRVERLLG